MNDYRPMAQVLQEALTTVYPDAVFPIFYTGDALEYVVWNYSVIHVVWAEHAPHAARYLVQVHLYLPHGKNPQEPIQALSRAVYDAGFTWPDLTDASDEEGQHWVLECEYVDEGGYYGKS